MPCSVSLNQKSYRMANVAFRLGNRVEHFKRVEERWDY